jgi:hypothetical protein
MSRTMIRWTMASALALGTLGAIGGFTPGVATAEAAPSVSPFAGSWSGTWAHVEDDVVGTFDWTISDAGRISGAGYSITNDFGVTVVGHVGADGNLMFVAAAPADSPSDDPGAYPQYGTAVIDDDGKLVVSATGTWSGAFSLVAILERN